jgi:hypothetical protein
MLVILAFEAMVPGVWLDEALTSEPEMFEMLREDFGDVIDELGTELLFWVNLYEDNAAAPIHPAQMESYLQSLLAMCGREFCHCSLMLLAEPASWLSPPESFQEGMDEPHNND